MAVAVFALVAATVWADIPDQFSIQRAEFARYYRQITGKDVPNDTVRFAIDPKVSKSGHDAYRIVSKGSGVAITGSNLLSVWYGLYDLLERCGDCGWFWDGDVVPKKDEIDLSGLDVHEESRFEYRGIRYFAHRGLTRFQAEHWGFDDWKREIDWCLKKRLNLFMLRIGQDDLFQKAFPDVCAYPDASKPLPGTGRGFDNRSLFWPLQFRGELRKKVMDYAFERGMMAPEDFGTMTHWYSRTPQDFLDKMKPDFMPQATGLYGEPSGLVWDIRKPKWMDAYWRLTDASIREYGREGLLHTIGVAERRLSKNRAENLALKVKWTNMLLDEAKRRHPGSTRLLAGWDLYCMKTPDAVREFLSHIPEDVVIWDYEADAYERTNFTEWDVIGRRPYTFGIFMAYESGLDPRMDYARVIARQRAIENDDRCVGYILWPESSHVDSMGLEYFTKNAWNADRTDVGALVRGYCERRYPEGEASRMERLWNDAISISTNVQTLWRWNYAYAIIGHWGNDRLVGNASECPSPRPDSAFSGASSLLRGLSEVDWDAGEFVRRDAMDLARVVCDRLAVEAENRFLNAYFLWRDHGGSASQVQAASRVAIARVRLMAWLLSLHTDYSLVDTLNRANAVCRVPNSDFGRVLIDNCSNGYCASHQAEMAEHMYAPAAEAFVADVLSRVDRGDRSPLTGETVRNVRLAVLEKSLDSLASGRARTAEEFRGVLSAFARTLAGLQGEQELMYTKKGGQ